jgi:hypothetical protein
MVASKAELVRHRHQMHPVVLSHATGAKCKETFKDRAQLQSHLQSQQHHLPTTAKVNKPSAIQCLTCHRTFSRNSHLRRHERTAHAIHITEKRCSTVDSTAAKRSFSVGAADGDPLAEIGDTDMFDLASISDEFYATDQPF